MNIRSLTQIFKLAADETRLTVLDMLSYGELHVTDMCDRLGQSQPAVSHHLALLKVSGLIECRRQGKHNFYSLTDVGRRLVAGAVAVEGEPEPARKPGRRKAVGV